MDERKAGGLCQQTDERRAVERRNEGITKLSDLAGRGHSSVGGVEGCVLQRARQFVSEESKRLRRGQLNEAGGGLYLRERGSPLSANDASGDGRKGHNLGVRARRVSKRDQERYKNENFFSGAEAERLGGGCFRLSLTSCRWEGKAGRWVGLRCAHGWVMEI